MSFKLTSKFKPIGDQKAAIEQLSKGLSEDKKNQVLLGVTGRGKSLTWDEPILVFEVVQEGLKPSLLPIGELIDRLFNNVGYKNKIDDTEILSAASLLQKYKVLSLDPQTGKQTLQSIKFFTRHSSPRKLFQLGTVCGSEIKVTGDHNFWVLRNGEFTLVKTMEIRKNDYLPVPIELSYDRFSTKLSGVWLNKLLVRNSYFSFTDLALPSQIGWSKLKEILGYQKYYHAFYGGERINTNYLPMLIEESQIAKNLLIGRKIGKKIKVFQEISKELLRMVGLYIAEGHAEKNYLLFSVHEKNLNAVLKNDLSVLDIDFRERRLNPGDFQISNSLWTETLSLWCGDIAAEKKLPTWFLELDKEQLSIMLAAYFSGDGTVTENEVSALSASKTLARDLSFALLRYGIKVRIRKKLKRATNSRMDKRLYFELVISGQKDLRIFAREIGFILKRKQKRLEKLTTRQSNPNVDIIPIDGKALQSLRIDLGLTQLDLAKKIPCNRSHISMIEGNQRSPSRQLFKKILHLIRQKTKTKEQLSQVKKFETLSDIFWTKVKTIEKIDPVSDFVYDVTVEKSETFLAGMGGLFVHNTFTIANVIQKVQRPTLVISHNKTLAGQLYQEFKEFFPKNAVSYFVSYYDFYQPEAYIPQTDTYIEKETQINEEIDKLRLAATTNILTRKDVIVVASVSCIYNLGSPIEYGKFVMELAPGVKLTQKDILIRLSDLQYERNDYGFKRGSYRVRGEDIDLFPAYSDFGLRMETKNDRISKILEFDPLT